MRTTLHYFAVIKYKDFITVTDSAQPVRNNNAGTAAAPDIFIHMQLCNRVKRTRRFIQNQYPGIHSKRTGNFKPLALAAAEILSAFLYLAEIASLPGGNYIMDAGVFCRLYKYFFRDGRIPHSQIIPYSSFKQKYILVYNCHRA